jgi:hypothetical protein
VTVPWLRAAFFLLWAGYLAWVAFESPKPWFLRWPMAGFALAALGLAVHFARIAARAGAEVDRRG